MIRLQREAVQPADLLRAVAAPGAGAVALFLGTVREVNRGRRVRALDYHAFPEMAESELRRLADGVRQRFEVSGVAVVHRTGRLEIGEIAVGVAVAAPHRAEAFAACRFLVEELKRRVPIWKKEIFEGGEAWIEGPGETPVRVADEADEPQP
jgi:molybdopterin synthase catalytic subunit